MPGMILTTASLRLYFEGIFSSLMEEEIVQLKSSNSSRKSKIKDLEEIASSTQVIAPHVPKIKSADITELFSGLDEAYEEAKRLSLEEKEKLEAFSNLVETFGSVIEEEPESLEELFSEIIEPETKISSKILSGLLELYG